MNKKTFIIPSILIAASIIAACTTAPAGKESPAVSPYEIFADTAGRAQADMKLLSKGRVMIAFAFGQSNSANFGQTKYRPEREAYNYFKGKLYRAEDPMLGAAGLYGSVWTRLADLVLEYGMYDRVVFITAGIGATSAECWSKKQCNAYLRETLADLEAHNIKLTHILWHQGEQDTFIETGHSVYKKRMEKLLSIFREYGQEAPMYVSIASYNPLATKKAGHISREVRLGQAEFINQYAGVLLGPDTDSLVSGEYRYDGVHFSSAGLDSFAKLWFNAIAENSETVKIR